jgi:hypothetical protein
MRRRDAAELRRRPGSGEQEVSRWKANLLISRTFSPWLAIEFQGFGYSVQFIQE